VNFKQLKRQEDALSKRIAQYLAELDDADKAETTEVIDRSAIKTALSQLEAQQQDIQSCQALMSSMGIEQFCRCRLLQRPAFSSLRRCFDYTLCAAQSFEKSP